MDFDENVRKEVVTIICDAASHALDSIPVETVKQVADRLRDKSVCYNAVICFCVVTLIYPFLVILYPNNFSVFNFQILVKKHTMEGLAEILRVYSARCSDGEISSYEFDWIPGKILRCFYDKDFRQVIFYSSCPMSSNVNC